MSFNTLKPEQNGRHCPDGILKFFFVNENLWISIKFALKYFPKGPIDNIPSLLQVMAWQQGIIWTNGGLVCRRIYESLGFSELSVLVYGEETVTLNLTRLHGPITRYVKFRVAHAPGMPGMFSPAPHVIYPGLHHGTHVPWCMPRSLTSGFI